VEIFKSHWRELSILVISADALKTESNLYLEHKPEHYPMLLEPIMSVKAGAVVVGSRFRLRRLPASIIKSIRIGEDRFGADARISAKLARTDCRLSDVGRTGVEFYAQGKKASWKDGMGAISAILKSSFEQRRTLRKVAGARLC
jgi:hypothetical protein